MKEIQSERNTVVKDYIRAMRGKQTGAEELLLPLEGFNLINSALAEGFEVKQFFFCDEIAENKSLETVFSKLSDKTPAFKVSPAVLRKITTAKTPQGIAALVAYPRYKIEKLLGDLNLRAILVDELQDPGNFGTIIRTAAAADFDAVLFTPGTANLFNPKVLRSTAGALFHIKVLSTGDTALFAEEIKALDINVIAASPGIEQIYYNLAYKPPLILVIGNENKGISDILSAVAYEKASIPMMRGVESLNAAVAASILIFEAQKQNLKLD